MALRNKVYDKNHGEDERPVVRPDLGASENSNNHQSINNGDYNQNSGNDDLSSAYTKGDRSEDRSMSRHSDQGGLTGQNSVDEKRMSLDQIKKAEEETEGGDDNGNQDTSSKEQRWLTNLQPQKNNNSARKKKMMLAGGGGGGVLLLLLIVFMMFLFSSLKAVHFPTVLRSVGFSAGLLVTNKIYNGVAYDAAVMTDDSTGTLTAPRRTMLDRIRRVNPQKTLKILGKEKLFEIKVDGKKVTGFDIKGKPYALDDFAQKDFRTNYNDLDFRQKMTVKNSILNTMGDELSDVFAVEKRRFRTGFYKGVKAHFNIRTSKWAQKARDYAGKKPLDAEAELRTQTVTDLEPASTPTSNLDQVNQAAEETKTSRLANIKKGADLRVTQSAERVLDKVGIRNRTQMSSAADAAGKASKAVLVTTIYCVARDINNSIDEINRNKEAQSQKFTADMQTTAEQIKNGDVQGEAVGAASAMWDGTDNTGDTEDVPPADSSPFYKAAFGKPTNDLPASYFEGIPNGSIDNSALTTIVDTVEAAIVPSQVGIIDDTLGTDISGTALNAGCAGLLNQTVQIGLAVTDIALSTVLAGATGGVTAVVEASAKSALSLAGGMALGQMAGEWIQEAIEGASGSTASGAELGIDRYSTGAVTTDYTNSTVSRGVNYARPLDKYESRDIKIAGIQAENKRQNSRPWNERYFAIDNPYSLTGRVAAVVPTNFASLMARSKTFATGVFSGVSMRTNASKALSDLAFVSTGGSLNKLYAQSTQDFLVDSNYFGVPQWGWSTEELALLDSNDESYSTIGNGAWVEERNANGELDKKYEDCYTPEATVDIDKEKCSIDKLKTNEAFRWRYYKATLAAIDDLSDTEITEDTTESSSSNTATTNPNIYLLGDSLMSLSTVLKTKLEGKKWAPTISAACGRSLTADKPASCDSPKITPMHSGVTQLDQTADQAAIKKAGAVVIGLGTNDAGSASFRDGVIASVDKVKALNPSAKIYWVNLFSTDNSSPYYSASKYPDMNAALVTLAEEKGFTVIDWAAVAAPFYNPGNIHPKDYGGLADAILAVIGEPTAGAESAAFVGDPFETSVDVPCDPRTTDVNIHDGYLSKKLVKHRMCAIPNITSSGDESVAGSAYHIPGAEGKVIVNSRASGAVYSMAEAALADGVTLTAHSSFRTMAHQIEECGKNTDCRTGESYTIVAEPGTSIHQSGLAIDFNTDHIKNKNSTSCSSRAKGADAMWKWLAKNAEKFGYLQYYAEAWHFDPLKSHGCDSTTAGL